MLWLDLHRHSHPAAAEVVPFEVSIIVPTAIPLVLETQLYLTLSLSLSLDTTTFLEASISRQNFLATTLATTAAAWATAAAPASAAKYGSFGSGSPEVLVPGEVDIDRDILGSSAVQSALTKIKSYKSVVTGMIGTVQQDPQANLKRTILKELDFAVLRDALNMANTALEEDSQRGTDRLIRVILQDITEIEIANAQKDGVPRSPRRLEILQGKLNKLDQAFTDYLAFFV